MIRDKLIELKKWGVNTTVEKISREEITAIKDEVSGMSTAPLGIASCFAKTEHRFLYT